MTKIDGMVKGCHALTIDVEDWFHLCGAGAALDRQHWSLLPSRVVENTLTLLDLLDRCGVRATFFVLGYIAERYPALVRRIAQAGHEIGSHGHMHDRVYELSPEQFEDDLDRSVAALARCGVREIRGFRAPGWSINDRSLWALDILARKGFQFDSSMAPLRFVGDTAYRQDIYRRQTACGGIVEFPPAIVRRFRQNLPLGGSWFLRMSRPATVLCELDARSRAGEAAVIWIHPWELDDDPPRVRLPAALWFVHYYRLAGFGARLEAILRGCTFAPLGSFTRLLDGR